MKKVMILASFFAFGMKAQAQWVEMDWWSDSVVRAEPVGSIATYTPFIAMQRIFSDEKQAFDFVYSKNRDYKDFKPVNYVYNIHIVKNNNRHIIIENFHPIKNDSLIYKVDRDSILEDYGYADLYEASSDCCKILFLFDNYEEGKEIIHECMIIQKVEKGIQVIFGRSSTAMYEFDED